MATVCWRWVVVTLWRMWHPQLWVPRTDHLLTTLNISSHLLSFSCKKNIQKYIDSQVATEIVHLPSLCHSFMLHTWSLSHLSLWAQIQYLLASQEPDEGKSSQTVLPTTPASMSWRRNTRINIVGSPGALLSHLFSPRMSQSAQESTIKNNYYKESYLLRCCVAVRKNMSKRVHSRGHPSVDTGVVV